MKKSLLEQKLEDQELLRLEMLEGTENIDERNKLLREIETINRMRNDLATNRFTNRHELLRSIIQTGVPAIITLLLAIVGFSSEQINGNPTGFTLRWLFNRAPR